MPIRIPITDPQDPRLLAYRTLGDAARTRAAGLFVVEGRLVVERLVNRRSHPFQSVLVAPAAEAAMAVTFRKLPEEVPLYVAAPGVLREIAGFNLHRGCVGLAQRGPAVPATDAVHEAATVVALEHVADPDNVGSIFRSAYALGGDAVVMSRSCADPLYRKAVRTSMGAVFCVPFGFFDRWEDLAGVLTRKGFLTVALTTAHDALAVSDAAERLPPAAKLVLVVGNEGAGLAAATERAADLRVTIPMRPGADSLNLSVAAAVALSHLRPSCARGRSRACFP